MLRFELRVTILVSAVPLIAGAILAGVKAFETPRPCIPVSAETLEVNSAPWHADLHVDLTDDPLPATAHVAATGNAGDSGFAVIDGVARPAENACEAAPATQFVAVSARPTTAAPAIHLSHDGEADDRIFARSKPFTRHEAAALIMAAHGERPHRAAAL